MARLLLIGIALSFMSGCTNRQPDLKSPCVGADGSPCARRPVNDWWHPTADQG